MLIVNPTNKQTSDKTDLVGMIWSSWGIYQGWTPIRGHPITILEGAPLQTAL